MPRRAACPSLKKKIYVWRGSIGAGTLQATAATAPPPPPTVPPSDALFLLSRSRLPTCSIWDDGTANPEPCLDQFTLVSKTGALGWLLGGMGVFAVVGTWAVWSGPEKRVPWVRAAEKLPAGRRGTNNGRTVAAAEVLQSTTGPCAAGWPARGLGAAAAAPAVHATLLTEPLLPCLQAVKEVVVPPEVANYNVRA